jgi:hypothetical protein
MPQPSVSHSLNIAPRPVCYAVACLVYVWLDSAEVSVKFALDLKQGNSPGTPAGVGRLATPVAAINLIV